MPLPSSINDLSTTAGSNSPSGSESPSTIDDYLRVYASYIAQLRDNKLALAGGTLTGAVNDAATQTIASASLTDLASATSNVIIISGTTTISALGTIAAGARRSVRFSGALILAHNAAMILPNATNITTAAGDCAEFRSLGSGNWVLTSYSPISGNYYRTNILGTVSQSGGVPTGSLIETGSNVGGTYIKFADGTMISRLTLDLSSISITNAFGSLFASALQPAKGFAATFSAFPTCHINVISAGGGAYAGTVSLPVTTASQAFYVIAPTSGSQNITVVITAIGRWF